MNIRRHACDHCDKKFADIIQLRTHKEDYHGPDGPAPKGIKRFVCPICGTKLKNERTMKKHIKDHTLPEVKCPKCDKVFKNKSDKFESVRKLGQEN